MVAGDRYSDVPNISVNANIPDDSVDCGVRSLGWCRGPSCLKYARLRTFVLVLACAGILQGACETYFRISAKQAALENGWNDLIVEWLLVSSGIFQAIFALLFAYWAHRMHPISWLSGTIVLQSLACVIAVIPSIMNFADGVLPAFYAEDDEICISNWPISSSALTLSIENSRILILIMLFVLQFALGLASLAFFTVGLVYLDDNSTSIDSPAVIATVFGAKIFGLQVGSLLILGVGAINLGWWLGWVIIAPAVLISGILVGLFPKTLPTTAIHQAAQRILEETRIRQFGSQFSTYIDDTGFGPSVKRIFGNKLLMFNIVSIMFIQGATINYGLQEESYLQSRFFLPYSEEDGLMQEWKARFISFFMKPPAAAISMFTGGLVISKLKLTGRNIAAINIGLGIKLLAIYIAFIFIKCEVGPLGGTVNGKLQQPYCSRQCICNPTSFLPVCPENSTVTYFSPCYAGCSKKTTINSLELYEGCSCGGTNNYDMNTAFNIKATEGACSAKTCANMLIIFQILSVLTACIYGMTTIGKIIISLRSVLPQDKGLALAMEVMFLGLFAYIPAHLAYDVVTRTTCVYWAPEYAKCLLRENPKHGNILNILTASLVLIGLIFDILVFIFIKGLNIYNCKVTDVDYTPSLYAPVPQGDPTHTALASRDNIPPAQPKRPAPMPNNEITVFRQPSSVTNSSAGGSSIVEPSTSGVTYAQVVFPPDKRKPNDGSTSPKRLVPRADVPLHHLSEEDVRTKLGSLKSFKPKNQNNTGEEESTTKPIETDIDTVDTTPLTLDANITTTKKEIETDLNAIRPQSPETDF
ncbi:organic anion transporting polypeptide 33Eb isoform 2-T2 [Cochliomyia hominivorax]